MELIVAIAALVALAVVSYLFAPQQIRLTGERGSWAPLQLALGGA